ncbi:hypothetical protein B0H13DRAFT_2106473 [Mycena leptocephala]|nr:hypothetical protein B0H13DRAFT_2106473 [Mycena leptocephala]
MRLRASLLVNLTFALLARVQADNAVSVNGLSSVPWPTEPALSDLELDICLRAARTRGFCERLGSGCTPRRLGWPRSRTSIWRASSPAP